MNKNCLKDYPLLKIKGKFMTIMLIFISFNTLGQNDELILDFLNALYNNSSNLPNSSLTLEKETKWYFRKIYFNFNKFTKGKEKSFVKFKSPPSFFVYPSIETYNLPEIIESYDIIINQDTIKGVHIVEEGLENKILFTRFQVFKFLNVEKNVRNKLLQSMSFELQSEWFEWLIPSKDATVNYLYAMFLLGCHLFQLELPENFDYDDIFDHALLSLKQGNQKGLEALSSWEMHGNDPKRTELFINACKEEIEKGNIYAMYILAENYLHKYREGLSTSSEDYIYWFSSCVETASSEEGIGSVCLNRLYLIYSGGIGIDKDYEKAVHWLKKGIEKGYYSAYLDLGDLYMKLGEYQEARKAYEKAIENKIPEGYLKLSKMILIGLAGFEQDKEKAERYEQAFEYLFFKCPDCWEEAEKIANGK